jgi:hypothetical protein
VISETRFCSSYSSFWRVTTPNSESVIKRLNLAVQRHTLPVKSTSVRERHAFLNEIAFHIFAAVGDGHGLTDEQRIRHRQSAIEEARRRISSFERSSDDQLRDPSDDELREVAQIRRSLVEFVSLVNGNQDPIIVAPSFRGCGIVDSCEGDLLLGNLLVEVKSGDRLFRSVDVRQLLTYCALNTLGKKFDIARVGCVNPRRGIFFIADNDTLSLQLASKSSTDLFGEIVYFLSSVGISS